MTAVEQSAVPRSMAGRYLRALWLRQRELRESIRVSTARSGSWNLDAVAVDHAAFVLAVRRRFSAEVDVRVMTSWVAAMREQYALDGVSVLDGDAMVRAALGEEVATDDIDLATAQAWRVILSTEIAQHLDPQEVDELLVAAERVVTEQGYLPSAVDDDDAALHPPGSPTTVVGRWVRARALGMPSTQSDPAEELRDRINGRDGRHVFDALLEVSVRRRLAHEHDDADIKGLASTVAGREGMDGVGVEAVEALTRSRLGERVSLRGISLDVAARIAVAVFLQVVADLDLSPSQVDALVLSAEQLATSRGHSPLRAIC